MKRMFAALAVVCGTLGCKVDLNGTCAKDSDCKAGLSCDSSVDPRVCVSACDPVCGSNQTCANAKCVSTGPTIGNVQPADNPTGPNGFYQRSPTISIPVTVDVTPGFGGQIASVFLTVSGTPQINPNPGTTTTGTTITYSFSVPTTSVPDGSDGPFQFQVTATDATSHVATVTPNAGLKVDAAGPVVSNIAATAPNATAGGVPWFKQLNGGTPLPSIDITADVVDNGSGLDPAVAPKLVLQSNPATQVNSGTATLDGTVPNRWHFVVPRVGQITSGAEGAIAFTVKAVDRFGHAERGASTSSVGIDGKAPDLSSFTIATGTNYPPVGDGCDGDVNLTPADPSLRCGHDGSHFWRRGTGVGGAETASVTFTPVEGGSGIDGTSGTCSITGSTSGCTTSFASGSFTFTPNFSTATLNPLDPVTGGGVAIVSVQAADLVGNVSSIQRSANVSRIRWIQQLTNRGVVTIRGAPIVSNVPIPQVIVAGTRTATNDAVVALKPTGGIAWRAGNTQNIGAVSANMIYDATSATDPVLYVAQTNTVVGLHIRSSGASSFFSCGLGSTGAPTLSLFGGGPTAQVLAVATTSRILVALAEDPAAPGVCRSINPNASLGGAATAKVGAPVMLGSTVYVAYDNSVATTNDRGIISVSFDGSTLVPSPHALTVVPSNATVLTTVAIADDIFFGDGLSGATKNFYRFGASLASATPVWTSTSVAAVALPPVVSRGLVLGVSTGRLLGFAKSTGATQFTYPAPAAADLTNLSAPATGRDGTLYFTDSANSELVALPPVATPTPIWTFTGPAAALLAGIGTEATLDDNGVLYFGQDSGNVYAIITDGASTPPPAGSGADWPRIGFDRCNSANASYTNCR
jgi:hypothetical protein